RPTRVRSVTSRRSHVGKCKRLRITRRDHATPSDYWVRLQYSRVWGLSPGWYPVVRQDLAESGNRMCGDSGKDVPEPTEGIDSNAVTGSHETPQHRGGLAAFIAAKEYPVVSADGHAADRALGGVVVDLEISVLAVAGQRRPVLQAITH